MAEKNAARTLLKEYISSHPQDIMFAIEELIPFFSECSYSGLQDAMNTVTDDDNTQTGGNQGGNNNPPEIEG